MSEQVSSSLHLLVLGIHCEIEEPVGYPTRSHGIHAGQTFQHWPCVDGRELMVTVLYIDGVGAYDHVYLTAMMKKLYGVPSLRVASVRPRNVCEPHELCVGR